MITLTKVERYGKRHIGKEVGGLREYFDLCFSTHQNKSGKFVSDPKASMLDVASTIW